MKFYLAGQHNFGNRGCEALVRSVVGMIRHQIPDATFLVPTLDKDRDEKQWPEIYENGCTFIEAAPMPPLIKWWNRLIVRVPFLKSLWEPKFTPIPSVIKDFKKCDYVLMIGGDVISLDYGTGSLFRWSGLLDAAHREGVKTMLFAASVGPFDADPVVEKYMVNHLKKYTHITIRESVSFNYVKRLGLENAILVADPAFQLKPQGVKLPDIYDHARDGVLVFNISPLIEEGWQKFNPGLSLIDECCQFIRRIISETELSILLLPHVDPLDGGITNSDTHYMSKIMSELADIDPRRIGLLPRGNNAAQLKYIIASSRYLIAARTHATVAGWSQCIPTISIAYSVKARGLNKDLFETLDYVLETPKVSSSTLWNSFKILMENEDEIRTLLTNKIPQWKKNAAISAEQLLN